MQNSKVFAQQLAMFSCPHTERGAGGYSLLLLGHGTELWNDRVGKQVRLIVVGLQHLLVLAQVHRLGADTPLHCTIAC